MEAFTSDPALTALLGGMILLFFGIISYGMYVSFGPGSKGLKDQIDEHARMHELGIAHGHGGKK